MAAPGSPLVTDFSMLASTTWRKHGKKIQDNLSAHNPLLNAIDRKGLKRVENGGLSIVVPLDYQANGTYQRYSGYDTLNISASDVITSAEFQWRSIALNIVASGQELRINNGDSAFINLMKAKIVNAQRTARNNFSADIWSDGTLPNQINGLQALVPDTNTAGTVGQINCATWPFWQTKTSKRSAPLGTGVITTLDSTTIERAFRGLYTALVRGDDMVDLIVADQLLFNTFEDSQVSLKRYVDDKSAQAGFLKLRFKNAEVIFEGSANIPPNHAYFLNTDYFELVVHSQADWTENAEIKPYNMDAAVVPILWMGNLVVKNRSLQGVFISD